MKNSFGSQFENEEFKENKVAHLQSKLDLELFDEEKHNIKEKIIRVRRFGVVDSSAEKWKIYEDDDIAMVLDGTKMSQKVKRFLRSVDGFNFLIAQFKAGTRTMQLLKIEIKNKLKALTKKKA